MAGMDELVTGAGHLTESLHYRIQALFCLQQDKAGIKARLTYSPYRKAGIVKDKNENKE